MTPAESLRSSSPRRVVLASAHAHAILHLEARAGMQMAFKTRRWTLAEVHALPDDGNKYELIDGELFVTPAPTEQHETALSRLARILDPYVEAQGLGLVFRPRAVFRLGDRVEVEPDLMVRLPRSGPDRAWETAPKPILVVEAASPVTRRRDRINKRAVYMDNGIPEYWILDEDTRSVRVIRPGQDDLVTTTTVTWAPAGAAESLAYEVAPLFE